MTIFAEYVQKLGRVYADFDMPLNLVPGNAERALTEAESRLGFSLEAACAKHGGSPTVARTVCASKNYFA